MSKERLNLIKQIANEHKNLGTTISEEKKEKETNIYTIYKNVYNIYKNANVLVNKIAKNEISKNQRMIELVMVCKILCAEYDN